MSEGNEGDTEMKQKSDFWLQDPNMPQEEVDEINAALQAVSEKDPRWAKLIWDRK